MSIEMWYLTRGTGIVAAILIVASLLWGFLFSARDTGHRLRPAWWLDLHSWLGGMALAFTGLHVVASLLDANSGIGVVQIFVPGKVEFNSWAYTYGVIATYLLAIVVFTSWPKRLGNRRWWRILHFSSVLATALALLHSYQVGSDSDQLVFQIGLLLAASIASYGMWLRLMNFRPKRRRQNGS